MKTNLRSRLCIVTMLVGCLFLSVNIVNAQQMTKSAEDRAKMLTNEMKSKLSLTDEQYQKVYDINLKYAKQVDQTAKTATDQKAKLQLFKSNHEDKAKEFKKVLTPEQYKMYEDMTKEAKKEAKEKQEAMKKNATKSKPVY